MGSMKKASFGKMRPLLAAALFVVLVFFARLISSLMQAPAEALDLKSERWILKGSSFFSSIAIAQITLTACAATVAMAAPAASR